MGLLVDDAGRVGLPIRNQIEKYAASLGYRVESVVLSAFACPIEAARRLTYRGIEALLVAAVFDEATIRNFPWDEFCAIGLMPGYCRAPVPLVLPDIELAIGKALHEAHARGYRRPGLALYSEPVVPLDHFEKTMSLEYFLRRPGYSDCAVLPLFEGRPGEDMNSFARWLEDNRPDMVLGQNGGFYHHATECGYRIPEDLGFISLMNSLPDGGAELCTGPVNDVNLLVQAAIQLLDAKLRHFDHAPLQMAATMRLEMPWYEGRTLPVRSADSGRSVQAP